MSDIEVLRKLTKIFNELRKDDEEGHGSSYELQWEDIYTIENLIKENTELRIQISARETVVDELEKENKELKKQIPSPDNYVPLELQTNLYDVVNKRDYILKSKVKEKIEELKKQVKEMENEDIGVGFTLGKDWSDKKAKIQGYKELLED